MLADGQSTSIALRWSTVDSTVARVDDLGFIRGVAPGRTRLVASAGGFRADTIPLAVLAAPAETLFVEDWANGLDTTRWMRYGSPQPFVAGERGAPFRRVFLNNGDYNYDSGVLSRPTFDASDGLTVEAEGWLGFTGQHWQHWRLYVLADPPVSIGREFSGGAGLGFQGPNPVNARTHGACYNVELRLIAEGLGAIERRWRRFALQLRPDGYLECYVDGTLVGRAAFPGAERGRNVGIVLNGQAVRADIFHGRVVVTRGLRY